MSKELDFAKDLSIDSYRLDNEWIRQPILYMQWADAASEADEVKSKKKEALELVTAELDQKVRNELSKSEEKVTEAMVKSAIRMSPEYKEHTESYQRACRTYARLQAGVKALDHKRSALENMVRLWAASYYSHPNQPDDIPMDEAAEQELANRARNKLKKKKGD